MSWREEAAQLPNLAPPPFGVNPSSTALVIVDMQYVDAHRDYALGVSLKSTHPEAWDFYFTQVEQLVIPNTRRILDAFRAAGMRVIHFTVGPVLPDGGDFLPARRGRRRRRSPRSSTTRARSSIRSCPSSSRCRPSS